MGLVDSGLGWFVRGLNTGTVGGFVFPGLVIYGTAEVGRLHVLLVYLPVYM